MIFAAGCGMSCAAFSFELEYKVENSDSKTAQNDDHSLDTEEDLCDKTADHQQNIKCAAVWITFLARFHTTSR